MVSVAESWRRGYATLAVARAGRLDCSR